MSGPVCADAPRPDGPGVLVLLAPAPRRDEALPALTPLGGSRLIERLLTSLTEVGLPRAVVAAPSSRAREVGRLLGDRADVLPVPEQGRIAALKAALPAVTGGSVLVHDAERALTPPATVRAVLDALDEDVDAVVPALAVTDSVKASGPAGLRNVDRDALVTLQAPRLLRRELLTAMAADPDGPDDEITRALARRARVRRVAGSHRGFAIADRLSLWEAQISLGLARDVGDRRRSPAHES